MESEQEMQNRIALDEARQEEAISPERATPKNSRSEEPAISIASDAPFIFAICLASLKDLLDYAGVGSLPLIGTALTFVFSIAMAMLIFLADTKRFGSNLIMLGTGTGVEAFLFGLNFLPLLTATALAIYIRTIIRRKSASLPLGSVAEKALK